MKKFLIMLLTFSMLVGLFVSCDNTDIDSSSEQESSQQSSTQEDASSESEENTDKPSTDQSLMAMPYLVDLGYYTTISHGKYDFGASAKEGNDFNYMIFWEYEDYASALSAAVAPIVDKEFFENNIVIYIDNPYYQREINDIKIGFRDFRYSNSKMEITLDTFLFENGVYDLTYPFVCSTYIAIPKTQEHGLESYSINFSVELELKLNDIGVENVTYSATQGELPIYEDERLWLIRDAEDYATFIREEKDIFNGASADLRYDLPGIIHYSPYKHQNSFLQVYENAHIHEDGTIYVEHRRFFDDEREAPTEYEPAYTFISLEKSKIDISRANGRVVCEDYDYIASQNTITAESEPPRQSEYYKEVILSEGIQAYNPPMDYLDYYEVFYLFKTTEELYDFGFKTNLSRHGININNYYYLISSRSYYDRAYADIGFSNLRIEDGVPKIDLHQAPTEPKGDSENLSLILIPRAELPSGISAGDIQINYVTEKYLGELAYVSHNGKTDKAEIGSGHIYTNLRLFLSDNGQYSGDYQSKKPETNPLANQISLDGVSIDFFKENIVVVIERRINRLGYCEILGYKDAKMVDGTLVITAQVISDNSDMDLIIDGNATWDDQIIIPRSMLNNAEISSATPVRIQLDAKHQIDYRIYGILEDASE